MIEVVLPPILHPLFMLLILDAEPVLVSANQVTDIFAGSAIFIDNDLRLDELSHGRRHRNI